MWVNGKRWFKVAGVCIAVGLVLMLAALCLVGGNIARLNSSIPVGVNLVGDGVYLASDQVPAAPAALDAPSAPSSPVSFAAAVVDSWEQPIADAPGTFGVEDRAALAHRALACLLDAFA